MGFLIKIFLQFIVVNMNVLKLQRHVNPELLRFLNINELQKICDSLNEFSKKNINMKIKITAAKN